MVQQPSPQQHLEAHMQESLADCFAGDAWQNLDRISSALCRYWAVHLDGVSVGAASMHPLQAQAVLVDSGTSLILASDQDAATVNLVGCQTSPCI